MSPSYLSDVFNTQLQRHRTLVVHAVLVSVRLAFTGYWILGKIALGSIPPLLFTFLRFILTCPILILCSAVPYMRKSHDYPIIPHKSDILRILVSSFFFTSSAITFTLGLQYTTPSFMAIVQPAIPVFTTSVAVAARWERATPMKIVGILLAVVGTIIVVDPRTIINSDQHNIIGYIITFINPLMYGSFLITQKPLLERGVPSLQFTTYCWVLGTPYVLLVMLIHDGPSAFGVIPTITVCSSIKNARTILLRTQVPQRLPPYVRVTFFSLLARRE
eukprot:TRINITY_DN17292_c0_g1_i1.p1 TRINITY_DN17292_c0_g1~~TRINITY_DN17292_c0_g1_i1.p1  ORF type:complete len:289 (-),score=46.37 TRINITY_DN17292_c0_g1_i1:16-840(-)